MKLIKLFANIISEPPFTGALKKANDYGELYF